MRRSLEANRVRLLVRWPDARFRLRVCPQHVQRDHQSCANLAITADDVQFREFVSGRYREAVSEFVGMQNGAPTGWTPDEIPPLARDRRAIGIAGGRTHAER